MATYSGFENVTFTGKDVNGNQVTAAEVTSIKINGMIQWAKKYTLNEDGDHCSVTSIEVVSPVCSPYSVGDLLEHGDDVYSGMEIRFKLSPLTGYASARLVYNGTNYPADQFGNVVVEITNNANFTAAATATTIYSYSTGTLKFCTASASNVSTLVDQSVTITLTAASFTDAYLGNQTARLYQNKITTTGLSGVTYAFNSTLSTCTITGTVKGNYSVSATALYSPVIRRVTPPTTLNGNYILMSDTSYALTSSSNSSIEVVVFTPTDCVFNSFVRTAGSYVTISSPSTITSSKLTNYNRSNIFGTSLKIYTLTLNFASMTAGTSQIQEFLASVDHPYTTQEVWFELTMTKPAASGGD